MRWTVMLLALGACKGTLCAGADCGTDSDDPVVDTDVVADADGDRPTCS